LPNFRETLERKAFMERTREGLIVAEFGWTRRHGERRGGVGGGGPGARLSWGAGGADAIKEKKCSDLSWCMIIGKSAHAEKTKKLKLKKAIARAKTN